MAKTSKNKRHSVNTTRIHNVTGAVHTGSGDIYIEKIDVKNHAELSRIFSKLSELVEKLPNGPDKSMAQNAVQALKVEASKGNDAEETDIGKWFGFLAETAPDAWEVAVDTFLNPIKGISTAFRKIAERAKNRKNTTKNNSPLNRTPTLK